LTTENNQTNETLGVEGHQTSKIYST